jgi:iron complex transport system permease protein
VTRAESGPRGSNSAPPLRRPVALLGVTGLLVLAAVLSVAFGARIITLPELLAAFGDPTGSGIAEAAVRSRIPRTVLAVIVGAALGMSGAVLQAVTRNPLADPGILGINTGAALAVVSGIAFLGITSLSQYIWLALGGAAVTAVLVYLIGSAGRGGATPIKLALAGAAITAALSSAISAVLLPRIDIITRFQFWQVGSVAGADWGGIAMVAPFLLAGGALALVGGRGLNALALGDELASGLGVRVARARILSAVAGVLLCGAATAIAGPIAFVGLAVPHVVRMLVGGDQRWVLPFSALGGAVLLTAADVIGRVIARPGELEAGIVTALLGAPVLIVIARRQRIRGL